MNVFDGVLIMTAPPCSQEDQARYVLRTWYLLRICLADTLIKLQRHGMPSTSKTRFAFRQRAQAVDIREYRAASTDCLLCFVPLWWQSRLPPCRWTTRPKVVRDAGGQAIAPPRQPTRRRLR